MLVLSNVDFKGVGKKTLFETLYKVIHERPIVKVIENEKINLSGRTLGRIYRKQCRVLVIENKTLSSKEKIQDRRKEMSLKMYYL